ncbi:DNA topoisomerase I, mitochondrial-like [Uloborus diversus]|uniref:DNA topoisomerase I, mitochondrial-like n=1 Tax=Uloborus diversus TaxID=327109 RepID=UPI00240A05F7|nr:DNA topoisomerase I, mitochondrial-like [Uloborus diversus]
MNELVSENHTPNQGTTTPVVVASTPKESSVRPHGDKLKMMNPTPNGYSSSPNHKSKPEGEDIVKKHSDSGKNNEYHKHSSDHVKKKDDDPSKHKSSHSKSKEHSHSKDKDGAVKSSSSEHGDKEKKHSSKDKTKESKSSEHSKHSSGKEEKHKSSESKKDHGSDEKKKTDNFKENEKVKDGSSKESKHKESKEKHKEKHKEHKEKHKDKGEKSKEHSEKKEKSSDKHKSENSEKHKEASGDKIKSEHSEKHKEASGDKVKSEHSEKHKEKSGDKSKSEHSEKHKEKSTDKIKSENSEKHKEKHKHKHKDKHGDKDKPVKIKQEPENNKGHSPSKEVTSKVTVKEEYMSEDDMPLTMRYEMKKAAEAAKKKEQQLDIKPSIKREPESDEEPAPVKKKVKTATKKRARPPSDDDDDEEDYKAKKPKKKKQDTKVKVEPAGTASPKKRGKKEEEQEVWKWWEEEKLDDGKKWKTLEHCGPVFPPPYEPVPKNVKFYYDGKHIPLSPLTEEIAGFYGRLLDHDYTSKDIFNKNFFTDWRKNMTPEEREIIKDLKKCNFKEYDIYYKQKSEERKNMSKEEKNKIKEENNKLTEQYGFCIIDGHKQKIGNFKIEPPGLFRGRGEHPKMGMLKRRIEAKDVILNLGKEAKVPEPPPGQKWKEIRHDNTVSWLASWTENILGSTKYVMLNPSSKLKGEKDWQKYETARKLKAHADRIRAEYTRDFKSKEMRVRQRAVALYFIDKLALRAGNEKDEETADTVGCCSLRVEHITLDDEKDGQEYVVSFDFLGKDSIRYENSVAVEKKAYKNLKLFMENKQPGDDLFDRLNTGILNKYLNDLMEGLTAKVFRTYNASKTLQEQLDRLTEADMTVPEKLLAYNRANRAVAILCNHQRAVPKGFNKSMENLKAKMDEKANQIKEMKKEVKAAKNNSRDKATYEKKKKRLAQLEDQLKRLEVQATDREENKQIALGTSKLNYLDPRISVAWCKKWDVPIEKIYNRTQRDKFRWAIEMAGPDYEF